MRAHKTSPDLRPHGVLNLLLAVLLPAYYPPVYFIWTSVLNLLFEIPGLKSPGDGFVAILSLIPLAVPPLSCICGIYRGIRHIQSGKSARLCIALSLAGLLVFIAILAALLWLTVN